MNVNKLCRLLLLAAFLAAPATAARAQQIGSGLSDTPNSADSFVPSSLDAANAGFTNTGSQQYADYSRSADVGPWFGGVEYRFMRATFSEAIAFATVTDAIGPGGLQRQVHGQELSFDYDSSMRFYLGTHIGDSQDIRFSYWYFDTDVAVNGAAGAGQTIVDPFGNIGLGAAAATIATTASVNMNVFDLEYLQSMHFHNQNVDFQYGAGLRFADINQDYTSVIRNGGAVTSTGLFTADFAGIGPYLSLMGSTSQCDRRLSLFAKGGAALLLGSYDIASQVNVPGFASGGQSADRTRVVPMLEAELGATWHATDRLTISTGWLFQTWFDLGTSGGTFDGENLPLAPVDTVFGQTDDSNIMSFDGLFVRAELWY
jgi:hypothetical protein